MSKRSQYATKEEYNNYYREYRSKNRDKIRAYNREYNQKWRKKNGYKNEYNSKKRYPEKEKARRILRKAIKDGKVKRGNCYVCNKSESQGHHDDYSKPLSVKWFCSLHHSEYEKKSVIK